MFKPPTSLQPSSFARARHHPAVAGRTNHNGDTMSTIIETKQASACDRLSGRSVTALITAFHDHRIVCAACRLHNDGSARVRLWLQCFRRRRPMNARIQARVELEQDIQGALANGEFEVFYQPIATLDGNKIVFI